MTPEARRECAKRIGWTPELVRKAAEMRAAGASSAEMEAAIGIAANNIRKKLKREGLFADARFIKQRWPAEKVARLKELWPTDMRSEAIGAELGVTGKAVRSQARHLGLPKRRAPSAVRPVRPVQQRGIVVRQLPGVISAPFASVSILKPPAAVALPPLRVRILSQLARGPSDTLNLSSAISAKEMPVSQALTLLEGEGEVIWTPAAGPRAKVWSLAERIAA